MCTHALIQLHVQRQKRGIVWNKDPGPQETGYRKRDLGTGIRLKTLKLKILGLFVF